jgi:hypothetical protein
MDYNIVAIISINEERIKVGGILCILVLGTMSGTSYCRLPSAIGRKKK